MWKYCWRGFIWRQHYRISSKDLKVRMTNHVVKTWCGSLLHLLTVIYWQLCSPNSGTGRLIEFLLYYHFTKRICPKGQTWSGRSCLSPHVIRMIIRAFADPISLEPVNIAFPNNELFQTFQSLNEVVTCSSSEERRIFSSLNFDLPAHKVWSLNC